jgi:ribosomal protection tetracycline resistance protein
LINLRQDETDQNTTVTLYGEVQQEVLQATLAEEYGIDVTFRETRTICVERLVGVGAADELIGTDSNPFLATVGLRLAPAESGAGIEFGLDVELGSMPPAFFRAVEESARTALRQGNSGWEVLDCRVTMTHSGYWARQSHSHGTFDASMSSTAGDFRALTRVIVARALARAGTEVLEPLHGFHLEAPPDTLAPVLTTLARLRAVPRTQGLAGSTAFIEGDIPAARLHQLHQVLPGLTRGEGFVESSFDHYGPVVGGPVPRRTMAADQLSAP